LSEVPLLNLLTCHVVARDPSVVIEVHGELDLHTVGDLDVELRPLVGAGRFVVVDLSRLVFCSAVGVQLFLELRHRAHAAGGSLVLRAPSAPVRRILTVTGVRDAFPVSDAGPEPRGDHKQDPRAEPETV
jgi:stage II sporulation protein AA (anti-sigma F factor antagonist)